jgi:hypothetical protein
MASETSWSILFGCRVILGGFKSFGVRGDIFVNNFLIQRCYVFPNEGWVPRSNITVSGTSQLRKVSIEKAREAEINIKSSVIREEAVIEGLGPARLDEGSVVCRHEKIIDPTGSSSIGSWFIGRS